MYYYANKELLLKLFTRGGLSSRGLLPEGRQPCEGKQFGYSPRMMATIVLLCRNYKLHQYSFKWLNHIESIFNSTDMGFIFINQFPVYDKSVFNQILRDQFVQKWLSDIYSSSRGQLYSVFKKDFVLRTIYVDCRNTPEFG